MLAQFNLVLTKDDYIDGLRTVMGELGRQDPYRNRRIWEQLAAFTLLFIVLFAMFRDASMAVLVTLLAQVGLNSALGEHWVRRSTGASYDPSTAHSTVSISEDGIEDRTAVRTRKWDWAAVRQVHDTGAALVFELDGWDMVILPRRLWPDDPSRTAFLNRVRSLVPPRTKPLSKVPADANARDMLQVGAIAAGIDVMFAGTFLIQPGSGQGSAIIVFGLLVSAVAGYFAYRLARFVLAEHYQHWPRLALTLSHVLVLAVPIYMLAAYFGWL